MLYSSIIKEIPNIDLGDYIEIKECRPISKIIHFIVINKVLSKGEEK